MNTSDIYNAAQLIECIQQVGFLPLLDSGIWGYSAEEMVTEDCRYVTFPDGGWDWPLWKWKGPIVTEGNCMYGKFFNKKAGFVSREWWPDLCNYRRSQHPVPESGTIEDVILTTLNEHGSLITRQLRSLCGFTGPKMRSRFDAIVTRLQMGCYIVTEDFVYPCDRHNHEYGCSLLPNSSTVLLPVSALVPQKSLSSGCSHIYEPFYPKQKRRNLKGYSFDYRTQMKQKRSLTICGRPFII